MTGLLISESTAASTSPVLEVIGDRSVNEDNQISFTLSATDPDDDSLLFSASDMPFGAMLNNSTGEFRWTPTYEQAGTYLTKFVVSDGSNVDSEYITITVNDVNREPVLSPLSTIQVNENEEINITLSATDPDGDLLVFGKDVSYGNIEDNIFTWTPGYTDQGIHTIEFSVSDGQSKVTRNAEINVTNVNRDPVLYPISDTIVQTNEDIIIELNAFDPDGDSLNYTNITELPGGATLDPSTGVFIWTNPAELGTKALTFKVDDGFESDTETATIVIVASNPNLPPVIDTLDTLYVNENSTLNFELSATDPEGDSLAFSWPTGLPNTASISMQSSSVNVSWTPTYEEAGNYHAVFRVADSHSSYRVVDIVVSDINRAPVIDLVADSTVAENDVLYINLSASDEDNDDLTFTTNSSLGIIRGNTFICKPDYSDEGSHDVLFTVSDGSLSNSTVSKITVTDVNMPPKLNPVSSKEIDYNDTLEFNLSTEDVDTDDSLTYTCLETPANATLDSSSGLFTWTPVESQVGTYSVSFYVTDGNAEDYETVSITVTEPSESESKSTSSSGSSGGGGGGSQNTGEKYENIDFKDYALKYVMKDKETIFEFDEPANNIVSISFVSQLNGGQTKALIEILKGTSSLVSSAPSGNVYRNLNIWVGDSKFPSDVIDDVVIRFKVEKSWVYSNDIEPESIVLSRYYSEKWSPLETSFESEGDDYLYYAAKSPGFSPFVILVPEISETVLSEDISDENTTVMSMGDEIVPVETGVNQDKKSIKTLLFFLLAAIIAAVGAVGYRYRGHYEKLYLQISNPDGKRYRRFKK
ncbi:PGF-pre-PGF domain-containing protein [Methanolobus bombayensis]|uniref:PGF-pre-PGF domain-containing protein n=1 Tax=Methanolobus bombayensis TaxID=38023 RepID=UPI001AE43046|nr:PGF-pre-PGF domain-containing protein [Methanolobus bombayensis]